MPKRNKSTSDNIHLPAVHPGQHVRHTILAPKKMSVTEAAKIVGVGRPALSNFLNGKAALTKGMASRIERSFGVSTQSLLDIQATYDAAKAKTNGAPANTMSYVPPFLGIKANDIETWAAQNITARIRLSVLLRTLVNSTGIGLKSVDFPGNNDAERPGWDGFINAMEGTPWIPEGLSGWEFGTTKSVKGKADGDFIKSVKATDKAARDQTTFVFVAPRRWDGKKKWIEDQKAKGQWKDVRAYDASDLEQWLEQSIAGQAWFANETNRPSKGVRSLDKCWSDWANVASPPLVATLFTPANDAARRTMISRLSGRPEEPTVIAADSTEEALAFIAQLFGEGELATHRDKIVVFNQPGVLPLLAQGAQNFIAVATTRDVEREFAPFVGTMHMIAVYPRNGASADPHVVLEPLNYDAFRTSLEEMGYDHDKIDKFSNESGRSLTVLRRRLSIIPAVQTPDWAADETTAATLVPFLFVGAWNSANEADQIALSLLADRQSYEVLEKQCQRLLQLNDAPVWSVGAYRGVVSKIDLLFAIAGIITSQDLERYFELARIILSEDDPTLDLPEKERWAASFHGVSREFSAALREGFSETLVLLAVHGNHLFQDRLGFNAEARTNRFIRELLTPLTTRKLEANDLDLPTYSEAAPDEFLSILEQDLKIGQPASIGLMRLTASDIFGGGCARSGLLWALENLAWDPVTLPRVVLILAQLAEVEIDDNWGNKPIASLETIFRAWMPQTAANHDQRLEVMKLLARKFPSIAWKICVDQFAYGSRIGHYSHKPRWRTNAHGFGEPFSMRAPVIAFTREMIEMALSWKNHTREMLGDLVERLHNLDDLHQARVWSLVKTWANTDASDTDKAWVRERIRLTVLSRRGMKRAKKASGPNIATEAKVAYHALEPSDLLNQHVWLFRDTWVEESADEFRDEDFDFQKREERIAKLRVDALHEIVAAHGIAGVFELAEMGKAAFQIGRLMATEVLEESELQDFLLGALVPGSNNNLWVKKNLISGGLHALQDEKQRTRVVKRATKELSQADQARLLLLAPFSKRTWQMVGQLEKTHRQTYWDEVVPQWLDQSEDLINEAVECLLRAQRPRAAFECAHFQLELLKPKLLFHLMSDMAKKGGNDLSGHYQPTSYDIEKAFALIDKSPVPTIDQKAGLEFAYIEVLSKRSNQQGFGIPNLEKHIEANPEFFVQAVVWTYKRKDDGEDPKELRVEPENCQYFAERGHRLLDGIQRIPGCDDAQEPNVNGLSVWVKVVRDACTELGRLEIADICIGNLLACAPEGTDGVWPCESVRQVMEDIQSENISKGAHTGLYNARGVHCRGEGGDQERELADKYRAWAQALQFSHPFVASTLLMGMVKTYENEANYEDVEAGIRRRLR